jgi:hypothetical protein
MVTLNTPNGTVSNGEFLPIMFVHPLVCTKDVAGFESGVRYDCYITRCDHGRFAVFTSSGLRPTLYHVFDSERELHDHFQES